MKNGKKRILIVDDHPIVRQGFTLLLNQEPDLIVCGEAEEPRQALELAAAVDPELVLVDISLKESNGIELIKDLRARFPSLPILVVSLHDENVYAERTLRAGAKGFVMKAEPTEVLLQAIRTVLSGELYLSKRMRTKMLDRMFSSARSGDASPVDALSDRELEVFQLIGEGLGTRTIADRLSLSVKTVETHKSRIKTKLHLRDGTELIQYAVKWALSEHRTDAQS
jgi:DNA-binding NarL/FixJ family response regulator